MTGQEAANVAKAFDEELISQGCLNEIRRWYPWWCCLSIVSVTGKPIKFTGTGEKLNEIERHPIVWLTVFRYGGHVNPIEKARWVW